MGQSQSTDTRYTNVPAWLRDRILADRSAAVQWADAHPNDFADLCESTVQRAKSGEVTNKYHALDAVRRSLGRTTTGYTDLHTSEAVWEADRQAARGLIILLREAHESLQGLIDPRF